MTVRVAVDFGTSSTCVVVSVDGREPQVVVVDGQPLVPSAVFAAADGTLFVGQEAERQAAVDPARYEPHPKRRVDEGELLLGSTVLRVLDVVRAVLARAVGEARRVVGGSPVDVLVLTHPADWGAVRTRLLRQAGQDLAAELVLVPEPVAAAVFHVTSGLGSSGSAPSADGALAVLDLGGGTVDASVVRRGPGGFQVLATRGDPTFGGADVDQALLEHVGGLVARDDPAAWQRLVEGRELADRRRRRVLRQDVRGAKETLSRHAYTDVPMPPPFPDAHVTRADLERLIAAPLTRAARLVVDTVRDAGLEPGALSGVFLVGGSSRIPLVARLVHEHTGVMPTSIDQPETVVARGALLSVPARAPRVPSVVPAGSPVTPSGGFPPRPAHATTPPPLTHFPTAPLAPPKPATPTRNRTPWLVVGAAVAVAALAGAAIVLWPRTGGGQPGATTSTPPPAGKQIAQYDYRFTLPPDWDQSGGDAQTRKVLVKPAGADPDTDLIAVQEQKLSYDSTAERDRAVQDLRHLYEQSSSLSGFNGRTSYAGKDVTYYHQQQSGTVVDWYVLFQGRTQISVGCQYTDTGKDRVGSACDQVVRTLAVTG
jgi:type VII secretion-associated protein (TIGR03931 family)